MGQEPRTIELNWALQKEDFQPDGSLRDIYVLETKAEDWSKVLRFIQREPFQAKLARDGVATSIPEDVNDLLVQAITLAAPSPRFRCAARLSLLHSGRNRIRLRSRHR